MNVISAKNIFRSVIFLSLWLITVYAHATAPGGTTTAATFITTTGATLNGLIDDKGLATTVSFSYGTSPKLTGAVTINAMLNGNIVAGSGTTPVAVNVTGLLSGTTYYYRVLGTNADGVKNANILSFTTGNPPAINLAATTQVYTIGTPIVPLVPTNTGGAVPPVPYAFVSTFAGSLTAGSNNNTGILASFTTPAATTIDAAGNIYVVDCGNNLIRKITPDGTVTTLAGSGKAGASNNKGALASFRTPTGIAVDGAGNIYVADNANNMIRKITPAGYVTTLAGSRTAGLMNGAGNNALFNTPVGVAVDGLGNVYVADYGNNLIRKITPNGTVSTLAGSGSAGSANGTGAAASFNGPYGVAVDGPGNVYVAEYNGNVIRKITPGGVVSTIAGSGVAGATNGTGTAASFRGPTGITIDAAGNLYIGDRDNNRIRAITPADVVSTLAGTATGGEADGAGATAKFKSPRGMCIDATGSIYVADYSNNMIRKVSAAGYAISNTLPDGLNFDASSGTISGTPNTTSNATNYTITAYNTAGNSSKTVKITVNGIQPPIISYATNAVTVPINTAIPPLTLSNTGGPIPLITFSKASTIAGTGTGGFNNGAAHTATFHWPTNIARDTSGNLYVTDLINNVIRKITPAGIVSTFAGSGATGSANGTGTAATFNRPGGIAIDKAGNVFVADISNNLIRKITPDGVVSTFAGSGTAGYAEGTGTAASFHNPYSVAFDAAGNLFVGDDLNYAIRKITPAGVVSNFAGSGLPGNVQGTGSAASFNDVGTIAIDKTGNLYVGDGANHFIYKVTPAAVVSIFAGSGVNGHSNGTLKTASIGYPGGMAINTAGNIFVCDRVYDVIQMITTDGNVTSISGEGADGFVNSTGNSTRFTSPQGICIDNNTGNLYVADTEDNAIREVNTYGLGIDPIMNDGLKFNDTTGFISGAPNVKMGGYKFVISAFNIGGGSTFSISFTTTSSTTGSLNNTILADAEPNVKTAVSPNGDGINDALTIDNIEKYPANKLIVTNAGGVKVFEVSGYDNLSKRFDGHSNITGQLQKPGTYFYLLEYSSKDGVKRKTGYFSLKY